MAAAMPTFYGVNKLLKKSPGLVWTDQEDREYGLLQRKIDDIHPQDQLWWIRLSRWTKDPENSASAPRTDETMEYPRVGDKLLLVNQETEEEKSLTILRYPLRTERGRRLTKIVLIP